MIQNYQLLRSPLRMFLLSLSTLALPTVSFAQEALQLPSWVDWGPTSWALGGAGVPAASNLDAFGVNPAGLSYFHGQGVGGGYWLEIPGLERSWGAGMVDGQKGITGGVQYADLEMNHLRRQAYNIAATYQTQAMAFGVTAHGYRYSGSEIDTQWKFTQTLGVLIPFSKSLTFGASAKALIDRVESEAIPPELSFGLLYTMPEQFRVSLQTDRRLRIPDQEWNFSAGAEFLTQEFFLVRGGYRWDRTTGQSFISGGMALHSPKLELAAFALRYMEEPNDIGFGFDTHFRF